VYKIQRTYLHELETTFSKALELLKCKHYFVLLCTTGQKQKHCMGILLKTFVKHCFKYVYVHIVHKCACKQCTYELIFL